MILRWELRRKLKLMELIRHEQCLGGASSCEGNLSRKTEMRAQKQKPSSISTEGFSK
jgi:hypothetical protein